MSKIKEVRSGEDFKVKLVNSSGSADLLVYVTERSHSAKDKDEVWCYVTSSQDKKIRFVSGGEDLKVFYVDRENQAKWKKTHRLQKRIG
jgi:coproporphyrinogen III oxidase